MGVFIKIPDNLEKDKFFYSKDGKDDIGIYQVGTYENGEKRHVYRHSVNTVEEAKSLVNKLNTGETTLESLWEKEKWERRQREFFEHMEAERKYSEENY